jgi:hypothetical protein
MRLKTTMKLLIHLVHIQQNVITNSKASCEKVGVIHSDIIIETTCTIVLEPCLTYTSWRFLEIFYRVSKLELFYLLYTVIYMNCNVEFYHISCVIFICYLFICIIVPYCIYCSNLMLELLDNLTAKIT